MQMFSLGAIMRAAALALGAKSRKRRVEAPLNGQAITGTRFNPAKAQRRKAIAAAGGIRQYKRKLYALKGKFGRKAHVGG